MRRISKFKIFKKAKGFFINYPLRLLTFKKSSWLPYRQSLLKRSKKRAVFIDYSRIGCRKAGGFQRKFSYRMGLQLRRLLHQKFDCAIKTGNFLRLIKKNLKCQNGSTINVFKEIILRFEYRLDILLFRLGFFSTVYEARQSIKEGSIMLNGTACYNPNSLTKKGDIIEVLALPFLLKESLKKNSNAFMVTTFAEVDYYARVVIIIKNLSELTFYDLTLMSTLRVRASRLYQALYH